MSNQGTSGSHMANWRGPVGSVPAKVLLAAAVNIFFVLPNFLVGALAVQIRASLGISLAALGVIVASYRAAGALFIGPVGILVDRIGASRSMRLSACLSGLSMVGIALGARSATSLVAWLVVAALGLSFGGPAVNRLIARGVPAHRRGLAFGVKNASAPGATLLGGLAVPAIALTLGWRWAFGFAAGAALLLAAGIPSRVVPAGGLRRGDSEDLPAVSSDTPTFRLAIAFGLSMAAASTLPTFLADYAVSVELSPSVAGLTLAVGSASAVVTRLVAGQLGDTRVKSHFRVPATMIAGGVVGFLLLATGKPLLTLPGTLLAFALGWGFNGLFWYSVIGVNPEAPAAVTGKIMPGGLVGGLAGPLLFGMLADAFSYQIAWLSAALWGLLGAGMMLVCDRVVTLRANHR